MKLMHIMQVICLGFGLIPLVTSAQANKGARRPRVIQLEEIRIEGRVQKPNAFYILNRSSLGYEVLDLRTSFIHEVAKSSRDQRM